MDRISVVIPTLNAGPRLPRLLAALRQQTRPPDEVVVVDSASTDNTPAAARAAGARVLAIARADFDHGGTRDLALATTTGGIVVFLTQDALPADPGFLAALTAPLADGTASAAFARQVPAHHASPLDASVRALNYPATPELRDRGWLDRGRVRAVFFSNVAAAVRRADYLAVGGFPRRTIMNEDMILCARLLRAGRRVAYVPAARVVHSHRYPLRQQFRRYFDIGVFFARHGRLLPTARPSGEGRRLVLGQLAWLLRHGGWDWIPAALLETAAKYLGFRLGTMERRLSRSLKRRLAMHAGFFRRRP
jgi:rhamnosyltransferase